MIKYIQIFGERYSGTNYLAALIKNNLPNVEITKSFGGKHWFIKDHQPRCEPNNSTDFQCSRSLDCNDDTLFLVILRNPFDWLRSLIVNPYHAPQHTGLSFSRFIRHPWISFERGRTNNSWPKNENEYYFIEEADNILTLRTMKILHWLNLMQRVKNIAFINYEHLCNDLTTIVDIADRYDISVSNRPPKDELRYCCGGEVNPKHYAPRKYQPIATADLDFIETELDWSVEQCVDYKFTDYMDIQR